MVERNGSRVGSLLRVGVLILLGFLILVAVVWTIARIDQGQVPQALLGVTFLAIDCMMVVAFVKGKPS